MRVPWRRKRDDKFDGTAKFKGKLDAVVIRGDKQIEKRENLGASWIERLRGK